MSEGVYRLVYYSRSRIEGAFEQVSREVEGILAASRRNNAAVGVTGALMFNENCFGQVLEGPLGPLEATFERIQRDSRHGDVLVLSFGPVERRTFSSWSMAYVGASGNGDARFGLAEIGLGFEPAELSGEALFARLRDILVEEGAVAAA